MSLSMLALGVWAIMFGGVQAGWWNISATFLGIWLFVTGILIVVELFRPLTVPKP